jgi:flagellin-specific chaperone FliS
MTLFNKAYNELEKSDNHSIKLGDLPSSKQSKPIWDAFKESVINLQQAISSNNLEEFNISVERTQDILNKIKKAGDYPAKNKL